MSASARQEAKAERRREREEALAAKARAPLKPRAGIRYPVILADPPWTFSSWSDVTGMDRAAENHYPTMTTGQIQRMRIPAADDAVLFLWATAPMIENALCVMKGWGFTYKSQLVWMKDRVGLGYWFRSRHEILLVGTKGHIPAPAMGTQHQSVLQRPTGEHSEKPEAVYTMIEEYFPSCARIELFARRRRAGWDCWGQEAPNTKHQRKS